MRLPSQADQRRQFAGNAPEFQIKDRLSFQRFLGVGLAGSVPDATTV